MSVGPETGDRAGGDETALEAVACVLTVEIRRVMSPYWSPWVVGVADWVGDVGENCELPLFRSGLMYMD